MLEAILWGLVQGLTEFLPVSSSGHLRLVPDLFGLAPPDLATSAVLHIGTLAAVLAYYRRDIRWMVLGIGNDPAARRALKLPTPLWSAARPGVLRPPHQCGPVRVVGKLSDGRPVPRSLPSSRAGTLTRAPQGADIMALASKAGEASPQCRACWRRMLS